MSKPKITTQYIATGFGWNAISKARALVKQGDVLEWNFSIDGMKVLGQVRDKRRNNPYKVELSLYERNESGTPVPSSRCSCPDERACLHATALALILVEDLETSGEDAQAFAPPAEANDERALSESAEVNTSIVPAELKSTLTGAWLKRLASTLPGANKDRTDELVIYVFSAEERFGHSELRIEPHVSKQLKNGTLGQNRLYNWRQIVSGQARFIDAIDRKIAELWINCSQKGEQSVSRPLLPPDDPDLFQLLLLRIIETGRAFWDGHLERPLSLGEDKEGNIAWTVHSDARQSPHVVLVDAAKFTVLNGAIPIYADIENLLIGQIRLPFSADTTKALLAAPRLPAEEARLVCGALTQLHEGLPLPVQSAAQEMRDGPPLIRLHLLYQHYKNAVFVIDGAKEMLLHGENAAVLTFDYGFDSSKLGETWETYSWHDAGVSVVTKRNFKSEHACKGKLLDFGFVSEANETTRTGPLDSFVFRKQMHESWLSFVQTLLPELEQSRWKVKIYPSFQYEVLEADGDWLVDIEAGRGDWFSLDLGIVIGNKRIPLLPVITEAIRALPSGPTLAALEKLNVNGKFYAPLPGGKLIAMPFHRVQGILICLIELLSEQALDANGKMEISLLQVQALMQSQAAASLKWNGADSLCKLAEQISKFSLEETLHETEDFAAELRPYQRDGLGFLEFLASCKIGGILADDMGLGKTVQTLAHICREKALARLVRPVLVLCPTSVLPNWRREAQRLAPNLKVLSLHGAGRAEKFDAIDSADLVLSTYPLLVRDADKFQACKWHAVILDEAQAIKNPSSKSTQMAQLLEANYRVCLTGTPIENHLGELWSQFHFLMPGLLGSKKTFEKVFQNPIEQHGDEERLAHLSSRVKPFILRRTKEKVAPELPSKTVIVKEIELEGQQRDLYETVRLSMHEHVIEAVKQRGLASSQLLILDAIMKLRQVCCDPRLVKLPAAAGITESAKLDYLKNMLSELLDENRRVLLFSQFTSMLDLIAEELTAMGIPFVELRGDTKDRDTPVRRFQDGEVPLFLISLKAGGTGLNLTAADTVIHYDPWWNPAVEDQASDRAHRIGQDKPVFVYRLVASGTIEQLMLDLQERKRALAGSLLDRAGAEDPLQQMQETDLASFFAPLQSL